MGLASEVDIYLRKWRDVGLTLEEIGELEYLWCNYRELNRLYGIEICSFEELQGEVMLSEEGERLKGS